MKLWAGVKQSENRWTVLWSAVGQPKVGGLVRKAKGRTRHRWTQIRKMWLIIKTRCNDMQKDGRLLEGGKRSRSLVRGNGTFLRKWGLYIRVNGRRGRAWLKLGIWKLRGVSGGTERRRCLLYGKKETEVQLLLNCTKTHSWRKELRNKWPNVNEETALRIQKCIKGTLAYKMECKWKTQLKKREPKLQRG